MAPAIDLPAVDILRDLARACEEAGFGQQATCLTATLHAAASPLAELFPDVAREMFETAEEFARLGAFESAAIALIPPAAVFTMARLADASLIAQVQLTPGSGAHSRSARWPAMALLAALLRAMIAEIAQTETNAGVA